MEEANKVCAHTYLRDERTNDMNELNGWMMHALLLCTVLYSASILGVLSIRFYIEKGKKKNKTSLRVRADCHQLSLSL